MSKAFTFEKFDDIERILDALPQALGPKVVQKCLREGAKPLVKQIKANAPVKSGKLKKSIGVVNGRGAEKGSVTVGPRRGRGKLTKGYAAHILEYGAAPHLIKPKKKKGLKFNGTVQPEVHHPGIKAQPFMRPAWDTHHMLVRQEIARQLRQVLDSNFKGVFK
jgi:HK97 gp10 family phage protein